MPTAAENVIGGWLDQPIRWGKGSKAKPQPWNPKRERRERNQRLNAQQKAANVQAKYGQRRKPAPVVVKQLDTGEVVGTYDQQRFQKSYADSLNQWARKVGYPNYAAYLESPHWKKMRKAVMQRDKFRCCRCGSRKQLAVHHRHYRRLGNESMASLETLCGRCHLRVHS